MANEKILVVDDDKNICELLRLYLVKEGYNVTMVHDGAAALAEFDKLHPDLVLLDVMMPVMDGWEVCRKIRAKDNTPIIMLTAKGETADRVSGLEMGADDYIVKPLEMPEMVLPLVTRTAPPRAASVSASVMMNAGMLNFVMIKPVSAPSTTPIRSAAAMAAQTEPVATSTMQAIQPMKAISEP